jgi:hypothetical protein
MQLFDPSLHTPQYIRPRSPLLFSTLLMAAAMFFEPRLYSSCRQMADQLVLRALAEGAKSVEVCQALICLTFWTEPGDERTWSYVGIVSSSPWPIPLYRSLLTIPQACRMAVELGLHAYISTPPTGESELQQLERKNRERTYLVLFVYDRSLSLRTGRDWMLPPRELVLHADTWHESPACSRTRPEDVILVASVERRRFTADLTEWLFANRHTASDAQFDIMVSSAHAQFDRWETQWRRELKQGKYFFNPPLAFHTDVIEL